MGITVQQVGVLTCASRLCLRSLTRHRQLLDVELYCNQLLQVLELIYKKCHGKSPAVVGHHKQCYSYFRTAAIKYETRQQSSSTTGLQLQQPTVAAVTSPPPFISPAASRHIPRDQRGGMQRGATWEIVGINPVECLQTPRFASTGPRPNGNARASPSPWAPSAGFAVTTGVALGLHRHRGHHARASPS